MTKQREKANSIKDRKQNQSQELIANEPELTEKAQEDFRIA